MHAIVFLSSLLVLQTTHANTDVPAAATPEVTPASTGNTAITNDIILTTDGGFALRLGGYLRVGYSSLTPDRFLGIRTGSPPSEHASVGQHDGFSVASARLNLRADYVERLHIRLGIDAAHVSYNDPDDPIGNVSLGVRDTYIGLTLRPQTAVLFIGRFKPPFDSESLTPWQNNIFVQRALESRGIAREEGFSADSPGFAPDRQVGLMLSGSFDTLNNSQLAYALALTNGNSGQNSLNDNDLPAVWGRLAWQADPGRPDPRMARPDEEGPATYGTSRRNRSLGVAAFYNPRSTGVAPNRYQDRVLGLGVDAAWAIWHLQLQGQLLYSHTAHTWLNAPSASEDALGGHAQISAPLGQTGLTAGYRWAFYNPRWIRDATLASDVAAYDRVIHHSIGLRYTPQTLPLAIWADYTRSMEQGGRALSNDRVELAGQVFF